MAKQTMKLAVGGPVQAKHGTYLSRPADTQLFNAVQAGKFAYVLACRQIGKSSLMFETSKKLSQTGVHTALIDLNSIGQSAQVDQWYFSLIDELARKLKLAVDVQIWWENRPRLSTLTQRFLQFLREVVLTEISESIVVFVDEIDMTLGLDFTDDFFAAIRSVHNDRAQYPAYHRLTFVLLGVATPDELIKDNTRTPFNIGQAIALNDFTAAECRPFRDELETIYPEQGRQYFKQVYQWTGGHPYLTQKLCQAVLQPDVLESVEEPAALVDTLVRRLFLAPEAKGEDNIQFVQTRVTGDACAQEMLRIYQRILAGKKPVYDDEQSPSINRLKLYGLVEAHNEQLAVRNKIYAHAFDQVWVTEMLRLSSTTVRLGLPEHYKILQEIGEGGFSTVYLAQFQEADKTQSVALKVLKTHSMSDSTQVKRFRQEARTVARLEHPNIIRILETGGDEDTFFIAMQYIPGGTVRDRLKSGPLARNEAVEIIRQIGTALTYAHEQGVIHRDVNPNNILLDTTQEPLRPVLTDFGLIKVLAGDDYTQIHSTAVMGTLDYMAPEQWRQETPTPATDQYALAITFFEMLSGQRPFGVNSPLELMEKHAHEPLPPLSNVAPETGPFFDQVLLRAAAKEPADRFDSITEFIEAIEVANEQAEEVERIERKHRAATVVGAAQGYIQKGGYDPDKALSMIEAALEICPDYTDALILRGRVWLRQDKTEAALVDYGQAYEQVQEPSSEVGLEYLETLRQVAGTFWQEQRYQEAVRHYETIRQLLAGRADEAASVQAIWQEARTHLVEYHHYEGDMAYAGGNPENIDRVIEILGQKIQELELLEARGEVADLQDKLTQLQIKQSEDIVNTAQAAIDEINAQTSQIRFGNEDIFQHYLAIDEAYQQLIELESENEQWPEDRRKKLREWAEGRCLFAARALGKLEPDYEAALKHYRAVLDIDQARYPGVAQALKLNLNEQIAELEKKAGHDSKYYEIRNLIEHQEYGKALEHLDQEFIQTGNYEHRDVARWVWGLVYAKQHEGNLPPEWASLSGFEALSKRLVGVEREHIQQLKDRLEPWSQPRILETINRENRRLGDFEEQLKSIEALVNEAVAHGVARKPDIEKCRDELGEVKAQIQAQRNLFFEIDVHETAQKIEVWLQKIEDMEALLQTGNPVKDIPEFLNRVDIEQQAIEADPTFTTLQAVVATNTEINREIERIKLRIRGRLVSILINDIGRRDDTLAKAQQESARMQEELAQTQSERAGMETELAEAQAEMARLQQRADSLKRQLEDPHKHNKYLIPLALLVALIAGGLIAPQNQNLPGLSTIAWIALVGLIAYFAYYVWVYYISGPRNE